MSVKNLGLVCTLSVSALACSAARPRVTNQATETLSANSTQISHSATSLRPGRVLGTLSHGQSERSPDGRLFHAYPLDLRAGQRVQILLHGEDLDPVLEIVRRDGTTVRSDDAFQGSLDSLIDLSTPRDERYTVRVTTASAGQSGRYTLWLRTADPHGTGDEIRLGETFDRVLSAVDSPGGHWLHFNGRAGERVRLRVTSTSFDTVVTVLGPNGQRWFNDDANDLGQDHTERAVDSTVELALPSSGIYHAIVGSYGGRSAGRFTLRSTVAPPLVILPGHDHPDGGWAGPHGRGRLLGLYVGISDYPQNADLYGCADDARLLAEAMRLSRAQPRSMQTVLTDAGATRRAVLDGINRLVSEATPEDLVMVFYSGHGNVQPAPQGDRTELDGVDETLVLVDGSITDTDFSAAFAGSNAGTVIVALDACHAGGFAEDFVTAPGRIGLFSSDEDVLSATAEPRRAGGYLSYWLRHAVLGEADLHPRDGVLQTGELTDFIYRGFVTDDLRMNPAGTDDPAQRLVVRRGSVAWSQPLWSYPRDPDLSLPSVPTLAHDLAPTAPH